MLVQIYGVTCVEDAEAVVALEPDHVGVVLDEGIDTWDSVAPDVAEDVAGALAGAVTVVALSLSTDPDRIRRTVDALEPGFVHLARAADGMSPEALDALRAAVAPVEVMTTVPVRGPGAVDLARRFAPVSDVLLLDTADPGTGVVGATGHVHDWTVSAEVVAEVGAPVVLAGGLGPGNVAEAIRTVRPWGVDSETRTSRDGDRRRKDPDRVRRFVETARRVGSETARSHSGSSAGSSAGASGPRRPWPGIAR